MTDRIKRVLTGGAYFFASNVVSKTLGFLFIVLSSRYLGPVEFGIFSLGLSVSGIAKNLGSFGLPTTIQRFLSGEGEGERTENLYGSVFTLFLVVSLIFAVLLFVLSSFISTHIFNEPSLTNVLRIFSFGLVGLIGFQIYRALLQAQEQVKDILLSTSIQSISKIVLLLAIFIWIQDASSAALAVVGAGFVALSYMFIKVRNLPFSMDIPSKKDVKRVLAYALPLVVVGFSYFLAQQTDRIMLGWLSTSSDVGIYTVSSTLALIMVTLHGSLVSIFMPIASTAYRNQNMQELNKTYLFISKWVGSINGIASIVFAGIGLWLLNIFGGAYSQEVAYEVLLILSFLYFFATVLGPTGALLQMADGHKVEMYNTLVYLILVIGFNYVFILKYGLIGAAIGTFMAGFVRNVIQVVEIKIFYGLNIISTFKVFLFCIVLLGIILCYVLEVYRAYLSILFSIALVIYIIVNIDEEERKLISKYLLKYVSK